MKKLKSPLVAYAVVVVALVLVVLLARGSQAVEYHRRQYRAIGEKYANNYKLFMTNETARVAVVAAMERERKILQEAGYLVEKDYELNRVAGESVHDLWQAISNTPLKEFELSFMGTTNRLRVWAYHGDLVAWEGIVAGFNARTNHEAAAVLSGAK